MHAFDLAYGHPAGTVGPHTATHQGNRVGCGATPCVRQG